MNAVPGPSRPTTLRRNQTSPNVPTFSSVAAAAIPSPSGSGPIPSLPSPEASNRGHSITASHATAPEGYRGYSQASSDAASGMSSGRGSSLANGSGAPGGERIFPLRSVLHFHALRLDGGPGSRNGSSTSGSSAGPGLEAGNSGTTSTSTLGQSGQQLGSPSDGSLGSAPLYHNTNSKEAFSRLAPLHRGTTSTGVGSTYAETRSDLDDFTARPERTAGGSTVRSLDFPMTVRFKHEVAADGENLVLTGWQGTLQSCEEEPIHCPGAVQAYGVLIAFDEDDTGNLIVAQVSENSTLILGITPSTFFHAPCLTELFAPDEAENLRDAIEMLEERDAESESAEQAPVSFEISGRGSPGTGNTGPKSQRPWKAYCAIHRPNRTALPRRAILELELLDDFPAAATPPPGPPQIFRSAFDDPDSTYGDSRPGMPSDAVVEPSEEDLFESTVSLVQPLKEMVRLKKQRARQAANGGTPSLPGRRNNHSELHVVQLLSQVDEQLQKAEDLPTFLKITAGVFRELTEFDRCMLYQFDENWNGQVVAEQVDWTKTKDLFRGLHFPASDIPAQAREMYKLNKVRLLFNRDQPTARLCCRTIEEIESPLDMTHSFLRAISPIHLKYLANMGVQSSMSISIVVFGKLWGLVALHGYGGQGHRVSFPIRQLCRLLSDSIGRNVERLTYAKRLKARTLINTTPSAENPGGYIVATAEDLLSLFAADFGCLSIGEEAKILGEVDNSQELLAVLEYLRVKCYTDVQVTQDITADFPDIDYAAGFSTIAGFLTVPLSREGKDFIVFCRRGQLEHIRWAGNPTKKSAAGGGGLEPRKSFKVWSETVVGKCRSWTDEQMDTPQTLLLIYGKFIDVWRQKESLLSATRLANLLLVDASKSVRTPLNAIISCLELALNGSLDLETRDNIAKSYAASRTLVHVINDLLDLTRTEQGNELYLRDPFDLHATIAEAVTVHAKEARRRGLSVEIIESPQGTPSTVLGDPSKVGRIIAECCSNAVRNTTTGGLLIEWGELVDTNLEDAQNKQDSIRIGISVTDTGSGISDAQLESMFREFEHISTINDRTEGGDYTVGAVGLGLARVARIVRTLGGQLRVESKVGEGSKFTFVLPFRLPSAAALPAPPLLRSHSDASSASLESSRSALTESSYEDELPGQVMTHHPGATSDSILTTSSLAVKSDIDAILESLGSSHLDHGSEAYSTRGTPPLPPPSRTDGRSFPRRLKLRGPTSSATSVSSASASLQSHRLSVQASPTGEEEADRFTDV